MTQAPTPRGRLRRSRIGSAGISRVRSGRGFSYLDPHRAPIRDADVRDRIGQLAIPPAWRDVWISPHPNGHIQASGIDAAGRRQYLYHPLWHEAIAEAMRVATATLGNAPAIARSSYVDPRLVDLYEQQVTVTPNGRSIEAQLLELLNQTG